VPDHPDHEQLAAFQAGDGDRRQRSDVEAHLAGCPSCAEVVASVERARRGLALLEEPDLPPGLHDRLAAAVADEAARSVVLRPAPWYRRPVAWGAAAALLLAALVVPFLDQYGANRTTAGDAGGGAAAELGQVAGGAGAVPLFRIPGEVSAATVRARLSADSQAKAALDAAGGGAPGTRAATPGDSQPPGGESGDTDRRTSAPPAPQTATSHLQPCLAAAAAAAAAADPATVPLVPAFYVEGSYEGRLATILVTTSTGQPGRVDLWVFPRNDCTSAPLDTERVR
jgi:Putative zinc-finger